MRAYLPGNRLQHLLKSEKSKKPLSKLQLGPALPATATDSTNKNLEAELPVLGPSYNTKMKSTKFKAMAYKFVQFSSHLLIHWLFICLPDRGCRIVLWISWWGLWVLEFCDVSNPQLCRQWSASLGKNSCMMLPWASLSQSTAAS